MYIIIHVHVAFMVIRLNPSMYRKLYSPYRQPLDPSLGRYSYTYEMHVHVSDLSSEVTTVLLIMFPLQSAIQVIPHSVPTPKPKKVIPLTIHTIDMSVMYMYTGSPSYSNGSMCCWMLLSSTSVTCMRCA